MTPGLMELENPLGFTRETAALVTGLGCTNLTIFKKRDISLEDLKLLTEDDLKILGVDENFDYESFKKLSESLKRKYRNRTSKPKPFDIVQIIENSHKQLKILEVYVKYTYKKMSLNRRDCFIEINRNFKVTQAIAVGCDSVLREIQDLETAIKELQIDKVKPSGNKKTYRKMICGLIFGGLGVVSIMYIIRYKN